MNRLLVLAGLCLAIGCSASDSGSPATTDNSTSQVQTMDLVDEVVLETKNVSIQVEGMTWGIACVARVKETLSALPGVALVEVDFPNKLATVSCKDAFDANGAVQALAEAGYTGTVQN